MMDLLDVLADSPTLQWRIARVKKINTGPPYTVDLIIGATTDNVATTATINGASVLENYVPVVGDVVQMLVHAKIGALVLGELRTAAPPAPVVLPDLPRVSQFYGGNSPYNITSVDGGAPNNLSATTMTNPDATRWILARGDGAAWITVGDGNAGYFHATATGATGALNLADGRTPENMYMSVYQAQVFTIPPKGTVTFRATAYRANTGSAMTVNYLRVTITALNWRPNGSI